MADTPRPRAASDSESPVRKPGSKHVWATADMPNGTRDSRFDEDGHALIPAPEAQDLIDAGLATTHKEDAAPAAEETE